MAVPAAVMALALRGEVAGFRILDLFEAAVVLVIAQVVVSVVVVKAVIVMVMMAAMMMVPMMMVMSAMTMAAVTMSAMSAVTMSAAVTPDMPTAVGARGLAGHVEARRQGHRGPAQKGQKTPSSHHPFSPVSWALRAGNRPATKPTVA